MVAHPGCDDHVLRQERVQQVEHLSLLQFVAVAAVVQRPGLLQRDDPRGPLLDLERDVVAVRIAGQVIQG